MSGRSSRKLSPESSKAKTRYDDSFLDLLGKIIDSEKFIFEFLAFKINIKL